ncbi:heterokaryon incompatibility protein-domain-containing protein, partial [Phaeosphaeriaceae sp. PMI808]
YVILSYCWGKHPVTLINSRTTSKNLPERLVGFPLSRLPKTARDAVEETREHSLRYLWIDAYCLEQDQDEDIIETEVVHRTPGYYAKAAFVISAATAAHSDDGFLQAHQNQDLEYELLIELTHDGITERYSICLVEPPTKKEEPIDLRAWPYQEQKHALCNLRFEGGIVKWQCRQASYSDGDIDVQSSDSIDPSWFDASPFPRRERPYRHNDVEFDFQNWLHFVREFSICQIGELSKKLLAFSSTAKNFAETVQWKPSDYKAGLWMKDLPRQLLWCRNIQSETHACDQSVEVVGPSWSWASTLSPVMWDDWNEWDWRDYTVEVMQCWVKLKNASRPYGEVEQGCLEVR